MEVVDSLVDAAESEADCDGRAAEVVGQGGQWTYANSACARLSQGIVRDAAYASYKVTWEPYHISQDEVLSVILDSAQVVGLVPEASTAVFGLDGDGRPIPYSQWSATSGGMEDDFWSFVDLMTEVEGRLRLIPPREPLVPELDSVTLSDFTPTDDELSEVAVLGDLVEPLGKYVKKSHEAHEQATRAREDYWQSFRVWAKRLSDEGVDFRFDPDGIPRFVVLPGSESAGPTLLDLSEMLLDTWPVDRVDLVVESWLATETPTNGRQELPSERKGHGNEERMRPLDQPSETLSRLQSATPGPTRPGVVERLTTAYSTPIAVGLFVVWIGLLTAGFTLAAMGRPVLGLFLLALAFYGAYRVVS